MKTDRIGRIAELVSPGGNLLKCPICGEYLFRSEIGVGSHLRKHVRERKLLRSELINVLNAAFSKRQFIHREIAC